MSDVTLLRTLTRKSTLKFGQYYDLTVQNVLDSQHSRGKSLLRWYYFNSDRISFIDDLLDELNIIPEFRITKPGKVTPEEWQEIKGEMNLLDSYEYNDLPEVERKRITGLDKKEKNFTSGTNNIVLNKYQRGVHSKTELMNNNRNNK
jgi:hypothetical protein